jgi:plastocyanin
VSIATAPGETLAFVPAETTVWAAGPIAMTFRNGSSLSHNLVFTVGLTAATRTIVEPGSSDELLLRPPGSGAYPFVCTIHDGMAGTLIVRPSVSEAG